MVKQTGHSRAAASLAKEFGKRLDMCDHKIEKKAAKAIKLSALMRDLDAIGARIKASHIWLKAKDGELPQDDSELTPEVRAHIEVRRMQDVADRADLLQEWVEKEKKVTDYLSSPAAATLNAKDRAYKEAVRRSHENIVREIKDEMTHLLLLLRH